jgi:hypothetical protein
MAPQWAILKWQIRTSHAPLPSYLKRGFSQGEARRQNEINSHSIQKTSVGKKILVDSLPVQPVLPPAVHLGVELIANHPVGG